MSETCVTPSAQVTILTDDVVVQEHDELFDSVCPGGQAAQPQIVPRATCGAGHETPHGGRVPFGQ